MIEQVVVGFVLCLGYALAVGPVVRWMDAWYARRSEG